MGQIVSQAKNRTNGLLRDVVADHPARSTIGKVRLIGYGRRLGLEASLRSRG
jgi:hypothetical protein